MNRSTEFNGQDEGKGAATGAGAMFTAFPFCRTWCWLSVHGCQNQAMRKHVNKNELAGVKDLFIIILNIHDECKV